VEKNQDTFFVSYKYTAIYTSGEEFLETMVELKENKIEAVLV